VCAITFAVPLAAGLLLTESRLPAGVVAGAAVVPFPLLAQGNHPLEEAGTDARLAALSNRIPNVRFLEVDLDGVSEWALGDLRRMRNLTYLVLSGTDSRKVPEALAAVNDLPRLQGLNIKAVRGLEDHQLDGLSSLRRLKILQVGDLHEANDLDDGWLRNLRSLPNLQRLTAVNTGLTGWGVGEIARLQDLRELDLTQSRALRDADLPALSSLRNLRVLNLSRTAAGEYTTDALSQLRRLERLTLSYTAVTDRAVEDLAYLEHLAFLDLSSTEVGDRAMRTLSGMRRLKNLVLRKCRGVTARGLRELERLRLESLEAPGVRFDHRL
jgi:Leucine-rich repeat (LRR) protein